jgi:hypothetical protein
MNAVLGKWGIYQVRTGISDWELCITGSAGVPPVSSSKENRVETGVLRAISKPRFIAFQIFSAFLIRRLVDT